VVRDEAARNALVLEPQRDRAVTRIDPLLGLAKRPADQLAEKRRLGTAIGEANERGCVGGDEQQGGVVTRLDHERHRLRHLADQAAQRRLQRDVRIPRDLVRPAGGPPGVREQTEEDVGVQRPLGPQALQLGHGGSSFAGRAV